MKIIKILSNSAEETIELGRKIGKHLRGGEVFALVGALGSGKTHFIKGIAAGALAYGFKKDQILEFGDVNKAGEKLKEFIESGDIILVKGSQSIRGEKIVKEIRERLNFLV